MRIIAHHYPNSEVRIVICQEKAVRPAIDGETEGEVITASPSSVDGGQPSSLTLPPNSEPGDRASVLKAGFGGQPSPVQFGNNARRTLLRAGGALERHGIPCRELLFLTGTLPGSTEESFCAMQDYSSYAVDLIKSKLSKMGLRTAYALYCWELQKRGALHIHYCVHVEDEGLRGRILNSWTKMWTQVIDAIGKKVGIDMWDRGDGTTWASRKEVLQAPAQIVRPGVGQYLAKYLSKGSTTPGGHCLNRRQYIGPVRWWGVSRPLLALIRAYTDSEEIESVPIGRARKMREEICSILSGMDAKVNTYSDDSKTFEVIVSYSKENSHYVFMQVAELLIPKWSISYPALEGLPGTNHAEAFDSSAGLLQVECGLPKV